MEKMDASIVARGRLAVLASHLITTSDNLQSSSSIEPSCVLAQDLIPPPGNLKGALTIIDERTGKKYQVDVSEDGTIKATDFKKITAGKYDKGLKSYDPGYLNTAPVKSTICYIDGDEGILRYRGYPIEELAESSTYLEVAYLLMYGNLPSQSQLADWEFAVSQHSAVPQGILCKVMKVFALPVPSPDKGGGRMVEPWNECCYHESQLGSKDLLSDGAIERADSYKHMSVIILLSFTLFHRQNELGTMVWTGFLNFKLPHLLTCSLTGFRRQIRSVMPHIK